MISKRELKFVNGYARTVPFPGKNYAIDAMNLLINAYNIYEKNYQNKEYNLIFSDGEEINFKILTKNLSHLLGIDFKNLISDAMKDTCASVLNYTEGESKTSFNILKRIIDRADDVISYDSNPNNYYKILNYYKLMIKCIAFSKLTTFDKFNFGCINFNRDFFIQHTNTEFLPKSTKFLFTPSKEVITPYFMLGIIYDENCSHYVPETIFAPENFPDYFFEQTLVLPTQVLIDDAQAFEKLVAKNEDKLALLTMYKSIINTYNTHSTIDIYSDYESILNTKMDDSPKCLKKGY